MPINLHVDLRLKALKTKTVSQYQPAAPPLPHYKPVATKAVYHPPPPVTHHVGYSHELPYAIPIVLKHSYPCEPKKKEDRKYFCHCSDFSFTRETADFFSPYCR